MIENITELVGNTPLVKLRKFSGEGFSIYAKLENYNPTGSLKDRIVKYMLERAEEEGRLTKDKIIIEASSGNTGIALSAIARAKGYRVRIFIPETKSLERRAIMKYFGAEVVLTSGDDPHSHIHAAEELIAKDPEHYYYFNQNGDENNAWAHYYGTGTEIVNELERVDALVAGFGTGGTILGAGRKIKEVNPEAKVIAVEPDKPISAIEGLLHFDGSYIPPIYKEGLIDEFIRVSDEEAVEFARRIAREEGIFVGISSGAALCAALRVAEKVKGNIVVVFADSGDRYLSTALFKGIL